MPDRGLPVLFYAWIAAVLGIYLIQFRPLLAPIWKVFLEL